MLFNSFFSSGTKPNRRIDNRSDSTDGQINKPGLSDGCRSKFFPSVARPAYNCPQFEGYMGNVGLITWGSGGFATSLLEVAEALPLHLADRKSVIKDCDKSEFVDILQE